MCEAVIAGNDNEINALLSNLSNSESRHAKLLYGGAVPTKFECVHLGSEGWSGVGAGIVTPGPSCITNNGPGGLS